MKKTKKFIDICSGIGGFRLALESSGHKCVGFSDIDPYCIQVYKDNFDCSGELEIGDITLFKDDLPEHDIICAGFPCQPFSTAGKRKGLDDDRGNIFKYILDIANKYKTETLLLENVKGLLSIEKGNVFKEMIKMLEDSGYYVSYKVICGSNVTLQKRERLYIVADRSKKYDFSFLEFTKKYNKLSDILDDFDNEHLRISEKLYSYLVKHKEKHKAKNNGFGFSICYPESTTTRTISHRYHKDGSECLILDDPNKLPRKLSIQEMKRLFTFPGDFVINTSRTRSYMLFGNSVIVDVIKSISKTI